MKYCIDCRLSYSSADAACPSCGSGPVTLDGFEAWAPELAYENNGFKADYFSDLAQLEADNFWFCGRNSLIIWALEKYAGQFQTLLEIGCGTGFVLSGVREHFPAPNLSGSEIFTNGLAFAAERMPTVKLMQMDARRIPFSEEFDVITAFDVLEHVAEDEAVLAEMYRAVKPGGQLLLTVPQHAWLWSGADEYACHERRYSGQELHAKVEAAGFQIQRSSSFVALLLPLMMLSRRRSTRKADDFDPFAEFRIPPLVNKALKGLLTIERAGIRLGLNFPAGGSRLLVARKPRTQRQV